MFARARLGIYVDTDSEVKSHAVGYIRGDTSRTEGTESPWCPPFVISGASGGGKSSFMADIVLNECPDGSTSIFHFVGCHSGSTMLQDLLIRIYKEFCEFVLTHVPNHNIEIIGDDVNDMKINEILPTVNNIYASLSNQLPVLVLVIDAINQLYHEPYDDITNEYPNSLNWLPILFPKKIKVFISCLTGDMLNILKARNIPIYNLSPLSIPLRRQMVEKWHLKYSKAADENIMMPLWTSNQCSNPLFLSLALNYLILHGSYMTLKAICQRVLEAQSVPQLLQIIIKDVEASTYVNGQLLPHIIQNIFQFVYCSREGLTSDELIELINISLHHNHNHMSSSNSTGEGTRPTKLDKSSWVPIELSLHQLLVSRRGLLNFSHDFVRQAVEALYFGNGKTFVVLEEMEDSINLKTALEKRKSLHKDLAIYFRVKADSDGDKLYMDEYPRPMRELDFFLFLMN